MRIYVGNLPFDVTSDELRSEFAAYGNVETVDIVMDRYSGRSKGFAFVEMPSVAEGQAAINGLNGKTIKDRTMNVSAARAREDRGGPSRGGKGGFDRGSRRY